MEDDDEFGDLYTDVLQPFQMSSAPPHPTIQPPVSRSIDLNDRIPSDDDDEILFVVNNSSNLKLDQPQLNLNLNKSDESRVLEEKGFDQDLNFVDDINKDEAMEENFGIEEVEEDEDVDFLIPGLSSSGAKVSERGGDDWDVSDSEDDLQIVLNDDNGVGMMGMDVGVGGGLEAEDDDEDGDNLVIVTGNGDQNHHQQMDEMQDWGEDGGQAGEERKDLLGGDAAGKGDAVAQKIGYGGHGYHSFHSQFKYVRPGAAPMPGAGPVATGGQIRPPASMLPFAGRVRAEWRPPGIKNFPPNMQKNFHPSYGMQGWGNNGAGRAFGSGLDFTLPSHKTIFEVDIDGFDEKPWRLQGIDISDFFNFGMNEESWKEFCKQLEQHRMEATMQTKIRVYESGRAEQEYDPDLPPELAAAAGHDIISENRNIGKMDIQSDLTKGSVHARMQLPTGKAIQVETGFGERLPSIDTRPPRMRDSDAIIEIVLQRSPSPENESFPGDDDAEQLEDVSLKENHKEGIEIEDEIGSINDRFEKPQAFNSSSKREGSGKRTMFDGAISVTGDRVPHLSETEVEDHLNSRSRKHNSPRNHIERRMKRTAADEESTEGVDHKQSPSEERCFDQTDAMKEDVVTDEKSKHTMKKQKLISRTEHSSVERIENREDSKTGRSSENENSRDMEQEAIQSRVSIHSIQKPVTREKHERERHQMAMNQEYRAHVKSDNFDRKKLRESERVWLDEERFRIEEMKKHHKSRENERTHHVKRGDSLKTRHNISDGIHSKGGTTIRESTSRRKRERDDNLDQHNRDDEQHAFRYKEEARLAREKVERQRERDEWKERGHSRLKEDYNRREKFENENVSRHRLGREDVYAHGNKINNEERISSRHEIQYTVGAKDMHGGVHEKKHKESQRKGKETDGAVNNSVANSRRNREDHSSQRSERASSRGMIEQRTSGQNPRKSSKKHKENALSEDEQQE